ncbi:SCO4226 family nickel-binding protein [Dactylosporangium sp. CA-092794]|uniref:SCO4226 family nickel-binding protein n=1 Tax=Dactylosporangium sp. CA-092794 TaxID=3239929 RepID=UPI003D91FA6E
MAGNLEAGRGAQGTPEDRLGAAMARFMDVHDGFVGVTAEQLAEAHEADLAIEGEEGVHFERAWLDPESGKVFCLSTGPSKEAVMRVHERAGHPTTEVYELPIEV